MQYRKTKERDSCIGNSSCLAFSYTSTSPGRQAYSVLDQYGNSKVFRLAYKALGKPPQRSLSGRVFLFESSETLGPLSYWVLTCETQSWYRWQALKPLLQNTTTLTIHIQAMPNKIAN